MAACDEPGLGLDPLGQVVARRLRHLGVEQDEAERVARPGRLPQRGQGDLAVAGRPSGRISQSLEHLDEDAAVVAFSSTTSTGRSCRLTGRAGAQPVAAPLGAAEPGGEVERAALADLALDPDAAAHQLDQPRRRSTGPGRCRRTRASSSRRPARRRRRSPAACRPGCRCRCRSRRSARPGLARRPATRPRRVSDDLAALGELDGVADQVDEDLAEPDRVADQAVGDVGGDLAGQLQALGVGPEGQRLQRVVEAVAEGELDRARARACPPRSWRSRGCR